MMLRETLRRLLDAARQFEMKTPKYRRIAAERQALDDAITDAQLVLSVGDVPNEQSKNPGRPIRSVPGGTSRR